MVEDIIESLNEFFGDIENCALLILKHTHSSDTVDNVLSKELSENSPNEGDSLESLIKLEFYCDKVLLASQQTSSLECLFIMA